MTSRYRRIYPGRFESKLDLGLEEYQRDRYWLAILVPDKLALAAWSDRRSASLLRRFGITPSETSEIDEHTQAWTSFCPYGEGTDLIVGQRIGYVLFDERYAIRNAIHEAVHMATSFVRALNIERDLRERGWLSIPRDSKSAEFISAYDRAEDLLLHGPTRPRNEELVAYGTEACSRQLHDWMIKRYDWILERKKLRPA